SGQHPNGFEVTRLEQLFLSAMALLDLSPEALVGVAEFSGAFFDAMRQFITGTGELFLRLLKSVFGLRLLRHVHRIAEHHGRESGLLVKDVAVRPYPFASIRGDH